MRIIAHRGLVDGPNMTLENNPGHILNTLNSGFDCEIDLWKVQESLYLGHDSPVYKIDVDFLYNQGLWIHAKNIEAFQFLTSQFSLNYFWHQEDNYTLTSNGCIWAYPGQPVTEQCVAVLPERLDPSLDNLPRHVYAICTDFCHIVQEKLYFAK